MANSNDPGPDLKGDRGGDTGNTKQAGKGPDAEKGDQRRENMGNQGPTRPGADSNNRSGSDSGAD